MSSAGGKRAEVIKTRSPCAGLGNLASASWQLTGGRSSSRGIRQKLEEFLGDEGEFSQGFVLLQNRSADKALIPEPLGGVLRETVRLFAFSARRTHWAELALGVFKSLPWHLPIKRFQPNKRTCRLRRQGSENLLKKLSGALAEGSYQTGGVLMPGSIPRLCDIAQECKVIACQRVFRAGMVVSIHQSPLDCAGLLDFYASDAINGSELYQVLNLSLRLKR